MKSQEEISKHVGNSTEFKSNPFPYIGRNMRGISFIAACSSIGQKKNGVQHGPKAVLSESFLSTLRRPIGPWDEVEVAEAKEIQVKTVWDPKVPKGTIKAHHPMSVRSTCEQVKMLVERAVHRDFFPIMVGGDHCLAMGSIAAIANCYGAGRFRAVNPVSKNGNSNIQHEGGADICVVWVDAHADCNTPLTSESGNLHGMPVAALLGLQGMTSAPGFESSPFRCLQPDRVGWIGLRDVDQGEVEILHQLGMRDAAFTADDVKKHGIAAIVERVLDKINPRRNRPVVLSFDVDGVDPAFMPSTGTAVHKGLNMEDALYIFRVLRQSGLLVGVDLVEVNPALGNAEAVEVTTSNAQLLLRELLLPGVQDPASALQMSQNPIRSKL